MTAATAAAAILVAARRAAGDRRSDPAPEGMDSSVLAEAAERMTGNRVSAMFFSRWGVSPARKDVDFRQENAVAVSIFELFGHGESP